MINEKKLSAAELVKREELIQSMKKNKRNLVKKYGSDAEKVLYGRATNLAKKLAEQNMEQNKLREMVKAALMQPVSKKVNEDLNQAVILTDTDHENLMKNGSVTVNVGGETVVVALKNFNVDMEDYEDSSLDEEVSNDYSPLAYAQRVAAGRMNIEDAMKETGFPYTTLMAMVKKIKNLAQDTLKEDEDGLGLEEDLDLGHEDNEPHMIKAELYRIGKYAMELYQMVDGFEGEGEVDFPAWWQAKITTSMNNMVGAKHYLDFEIKEPAIDAVVDRISDVAPEMEIDGLGVSELLDPTPPLVLSKANSKINNVATMAKALLDLYGELKQKEQTTNFESDSNFKNVLYYLNKAAKPQTDKEAKPDVVDDIEEIGMFHDPKGYEKPKPDSKDKIYTKKYKGDGVYDIFKNDEKIKTLKGGEGEANAYINQLKRELEEGLPKGFWDKRMDDKDEVDESYNTLVNKIKKQGQSEKSAKAIAGAVASYKAKGGGKGPTAKQKG